MRERFLDYYERELEYLYGAARSVGRRYPASAARLGLDRATPLDADPFVKQLVEGVAFLTARLESRLDDARVEQARRLLETVEPGLLEPLPACLMAHLSPRPGSFMPAPRVGPVRIERGRALEARCGESVRCAFTTSREVELWPFEIGRPELVPLADHRRSIGRGVAAGCARAVRIALTLPEGFAAHMLELDRLVLHVAADGGDAGAVARTLETLHLGVRGVRVVADGHDVTAPSPLGMPAIAPVGFGDDEALLPDDERGFSGDRLVRELFAFRANFESVALVHLAASLEACAGRRVELWLPVEDARAEALVGDLTGIRLLPFCTPAINLFERELLPLAVEGNRHDHRLLTDRVAPSRYEVHRVLSVRGRGPQGRVDYSPYFDDRAGRAAGHGFYAVERRGAVFGDPVDGTDEEEYAGTESFLSLLDPHGNQFTPDGRLVLDVRVRCTNRHLPLRLDPATTVLTLVEGSGYVDRVRLVGRVSRPRPGRGAEPWSLVGLLTRHFRELGDPGGEDAAVTAAGAPDAVASLRGSLRLLAGGDRAPTGRRDEIERSNATLLDGGLLDLRCRPATHAIEDVVDGAVRRLPVRGLDVTLVLDPDAFPGRAVWTFVAVLERYLARQVGLNVSLSLEVRDTGGRTLSRTGPGSDSRVVA